MASSYYIFLSLIAVVVLSSVIAVIADGINGESPLAKRRRISIERLRNTGRLRRIFKKRYDDTELEGYGDEELLSPTEVLEFMEELNALERLRESRFEYEKRGGGGGGRQGGSRKMNGWVTGMFGKRSSAIRETRNIPQTYLSGDYFGKRFSDEAPVEGLDWKRGFELQDAVDENLE